jgi:hypothetical protein
MTQSKDEKPTIPDAKSGTAYITGQGWQLSIKSLYRHIKQQKISSPPWTTDQLDRYAARYLRPAENIDGSSPTEIKEGARELLAARKQKLEIEIRTKQLEYELKRGAYIEKTKHEQLWNKKALVLRDLVYQWIYENATIIIAAAAGDPDRFWDVIEAYHEGFESYWIRAAIEGPFETGYSESELPKKAKWHEKK